MKNNLEQLAAEYANGLDNYKKCLQNCISEKIVDMLRIETQFECLKDWSLFSTLDDVKEWYLGQQQKCGMIIEDIPLSDCRGWIVDNRTGWISHESKEFFYVQGIRVRQSLSREVGDTGWDQPILTQVGYDGGLLGIIRKKFNGVPHYLVEAKAEPGNYDLVQISPTLQATLSNLKRAHGGTKPRFAEYFEDPENNNGTILYKQWMSEDGGRLHKKRNLGMLVEVPEDHDIDIPESFTWISLWQIKTLLKESSWVNPHTRGIIANL